MTATSKRLWAAAATASAITLMGLTPPASAGTFAADESDFIFRSMAQKTPEARAVGSIIGGYTSDSGVVKGSGVLIGGRFVLTAAHLVDDMQNSGAFRINGQVYGMRRWVVARQFYRLDTIGDSATFNPTERLYGNGADLALVELSRHVRGARRIKAKLNKSRKEAGKTATIVGFGRGGDGKLGINTLGIANSRNPAPPIPNDATLGNQTAGVWNFQPVKRAGKNRIEPTGPFNGASSNRELVTDFDPDPSRLAELSGMDGTSTSLNPPSFDPFTGEFRLDENDIPISNEFAPSVGDSGGGLFVNGKLAGITSWTTRADSEFFSQAHYSRVSLGWTNWVRANIAAFNRLKANPLLVPWLRTDNGGAGFKGVLKIRDEGNLLTTDNADDTLKILKIFGPQLFDNPDLTVDQNLADNTFVFNDLFASPAPLSDIVYPSSANTVPEPASLALLSLGGLAMLRRSRC